LRRITLAWASALKTSGWQRGSRWPSWCDMEGVIVPSW
jgi:hypothetical protein